MKLKLHNLIFVGMALGVIVGLLLWWVSKRAQDADQPDPASVTIILWILDLLGPTIFMGALKMIIAPLILASIVAGVTSLPNLKELGAIGWKTLLYYFSTTTIAVVIGLVAVLTIQPGKKAASQKVRTARQEQLAEYRASYEEQTGKAPLKDDRRPTTGYLAWLHVQEGSVATARDAARFQKLTGAEQRGAGDIFKDDIVRPLLTNPFQSLAANPPNSLGIIFFALLLGIACTVVGGRATSVVEFFRQLNNVIMQMTHWLMSIAPLAIACIMAKLVAENGPDIFQTLGWYCGTVIGGILVHVVVLFVIAATIGGVGPLRLWRGIREAWMIAFTTRSSAATLPVTIANTTEKLNVSPKVAGFSLPLGATMNMDGTALYEGVAVIFLIQIYGGLDDVTITMTAITTFLIFITAVLASVGAAAVPDAGLVTMVLVASAVHLPIYYIPLIFAVDAFLDMFRTSTNVLGDSIGAIVVNRLERHRLGEPAAA
jgi:solute carrier family 1 (high affinity glutamate transporter) protein 1